MIVVPEVTRAHVEAELAALEAWKRQHGWDITWHADALRLDVKMQSMVDRDVYSLEVDLTDYRARPPVFEFIGANGQRGTRRCYPGGGRGYFHTNPVICAPWNRKAYSEMGGPHVDWAMASWATLRPNHSTLGDMLALIQDLLNDRTSYAGRMEK